MLDRTILAKDFWVIVWTTYPTDSTEEDHEVLVEGTIFDAFKKLEELVSDGGAFHSPELGQVLTLSRESYYRNLGKGEYFWTCIHKGKWGVYYP